MLFAQVSGSGIPPVSARMQTALLVTMTRLLRSLGALQSLHISAVRRRRHACCMACMCTEGHMSHIARIMETNPASWLLLLQTLQSAVQGWL